MSLEFENLLKTFREKILLRGVRGIFALGKLFGVTNNKRSRTVDLMEF